MRYLIVFDIMELGSSSVPQRPGFQYSIGTVVRGIEIPRDTAAKRAAEIVQECIAEEVRCFSVSSAKTQRRDLIYRHLERIE